MAPFGSTQRITAAILYLCQIKADAIPSLTGDYGIKAILTNPG